MTNIARSGRVSFNFEPTEDEEWATIFTGRADLVDRATISQDTIERYAAKYRQGMINIKRPRPEYEAAYAEVIRVTPEKVRGW